MLAPSLGPWKRRVRHFTDQDVLEGELFVPLDPGDGLPSDEVPSLERIEQPCDHPVSAVVDGALPEEPADDGRPQEQPALGRREGVEASGDDPFDGGWHAGGRELRGAFEDRRGEFLNEEGVASSSLDQPVDDVALLDAGQQPSNELVPVVL